MPAPEKTKTVDTYLENSGYVKKSLEDVELMAAHAAKVLKGQAASAASSNLSGPKYVLPLSLFIDNLVDNYGNSYIKDEGEYKHFFQAFESAYGEETRQFLEFLGDGDDFLVDFDAYGIKGEKVHPGGFTGNGNDKEEIFDQRIFEKKEKFNDEYALHLLSSTEFPNGKWNDILQAAIAQSKTPVSKSSGRGVSSAIRKSKADKARKQRKKLIDDRNLTQQALLMLDLEEISKKNEDKHKPTGYKNFLCLHDEEPSTMMSRLMSVNFLPISKLKSEHFSALIPEMRFFKVETELDANGQVVGELGEKEFFFPTFADPDQRKRYDTNVLQNWQTVISTSKPNIGIRSIDWANRSGNYLLEKSGLQFNVQFYAERLADMFTFVEGYKKDDGFRYSDLFTTPLPYFQDKSNPEQTKKIANENFYRLRAKFGWRISENIKNNILSSLSGAEKIAVENGWKSLTDSNMVVDLTLVNFDLNFEEDGTTVVNVQYNSFIKQYMNNMDYSNILLSEEELEKTNTKRKKLNELEILKKKNTSPRNKKELKRVSSEIQKINKDISELNSNLSLRYSSLVKDLVNSEAIRIHSVRKEDVVARFQKSGFTSSSGNDKKLQRPSLNIKVEFPDYSEVSFIDLSKAKKSNLYIEVDSNSKNDAPILKLVENNKTGELRFAYYPLGSQMTSVLPGFNPGDKLLTESQVKLFFPNGLSSSDNVFVSAATEKSKQDQNASKDNANIKNVTQDVKIKDASKLDIEKYYQKLDKNAFNKNTNTHNIKYFYLGDLIEVALRKFVKNSKSSIDLRVVLGTAQLKNYPDNIVEGFMDFDIDENTGLFSITHNKELEKQFKESGADPKELKNLAASHLKSNAHLYYRNIADIPICFNSFLVWFHDHVVKKSLATLPLEKFIKDVLALVVKSHNSFGDYAYMIPKQELQINRSFCSAPKTSNEEFDYFGMKFRGEELQFAPLPTSGKITGRRELEDLRNDNLGLIGGQAEKPISLFQSKFANANSAKTNKYMFLFDTPRSIPPQHIANFVEDSRDGIPHFFIGAESGLVKSIKFNLVANPLLQADQMLRKPQQASPRFPIKGRYECDITLVGNNFFTPGMIIYLNPASLRLGNPMDMDSPINSLGIMGYYQIFNMSSYIQGGTYETKISCRFVSPGNGLDEHGRKTAKSPMGNK